MNAIKLLTALCETDVDGIYTKWEVAKIVEAVRLECLAKGIDAGPEQTAMTPREGLAEVGRMLAMQKPESSTLTVAETAERLQVCRQTIYSLCNAGTLPCIRAGRAIRIPADAIEQFRQHPTVAPRLLGKDHLA